MSRMRAFQSNDLDLELVFFIVVFVKLVNKTLEVGLSEGSEEYTTCGVFG